MKTRIIKRILISCSLMIAGLFLLVTTGCTRNNGDIGDWFGTWQVMDIRQNDISQDNYEQQFFLQFQNDIIRVVWVGPTGYDRDYYAIFGTWEQPSENTMTFNFAHSDDEGTQSYKPFSALHFPQDKPFTMTIVNQNGDNLDLKYLDESSSIEYTYELRKR